METIEQINLYDVHIPMVDRTLLNARERLAKGEPLSNEDQLVLDRTVELLKQFIDAKKYVIANKRQASKDLLLAVLTTTITVTLAVLLVIMLFGPYYPSNFLYPYFYAVRVTPHVTCSPGHMVHH